MSVDINDFHTEKECTYKGERYSVRDNGAVLRYPRDSKHYRPTDNKWTFGRKNEKTGYMEIASERVHRIVAFAFIGEPPNKDYVVDHIDTNRCNNRPENLRWLTKLENALNNPITARRIEIICGSIEAFLSNPQILRESNSDPNFKWMRTVTPQEAEACLHNMQHWAKNKRTPSGSSLGEWVFNQLETTLLPPMLIKAKTQGAVQQDWSIPSEFPCCPQDAGLDPIETYAKCLKEGALFAQNDIYESIVLQFALTNDRKTIFVMTESGDGENAIKPWQLAKITYEKGVYIHTSLGSFFSKEGAEKQFTIAQGHEWMGGDSIDDYC